MVHLQSSIDISASPARVYGVLRDPAKLMELAPGVTVLESRVLTPGPVDVGTRVYYRLRTLTGISAFVCEFTTVETDRRLEWVGETRTPYRARQTLVPTKHGCRLVHEEWVEPGSRVAGAVEQHPAPFLFRILKEAVCFATPSPDALAESQNVVVREELHAMLTQWLRNIRDHIESRDTAAAELGAVSPKALPDAGC